MSRLRRLFLTHNALAALVIIVTLAMKAVVPAGFMPMLVEGRVVIALCSGFGPVIPVAAPPKMAGMHHGAAMGADHGRHAPKDGGQHDDKPQPCAFSGLSTPSLAGADPVVLAIAIAFVLTLGLHIVVALPVMRPGRLWPPLRGPPALA
ncbi:MULTISPECIES: hypothetical protein [unclassified Sphingomonas]|uniref:hypothetical protein n=1 Tax=unclassified Sphingomonas TaxID=196159 RepID=UPI0006F3B957|nr:MULTISPECIES: hypothetical protein [unclassified Sphingomonas]KQM61736.1 hypothetical protein ASE65_05825 [Sphingomonas sp. Leaf16]KQN13009.1 hypothetical protein ASE81_06840 [Sphingomonas sp. Leaf29]KQN19895.1 hypothetical protein ASE83_06765 [Sphingomonas sp. Leaf32]